MKIKAIFLRRLMKKLGVKWLYNMSVFSRSLMVLGLHYDHTRLEVRRSKC